MCILQELDSMDIPLIFALRPHIVRIVLFPRTFRTGSVKWPGVGILNPAVLGIFQHDRVLKFMSAHPLSLGIAAVDGMPEVKFFIAFRNKISVEVSNCSVTISIDGIV